MTRFYTHKVANLTLAVSKRLTWHSCRFFALVANQCLCFTVTPCQARPSVFCKRMSTAKFKHGHIIKLWWAEWKLILKEWLKESLILHFEDNHNWRRLPLAPSPWIQCAGKAESFHGRQGATGFEPVTSRSAVECSPTELCLPVKGLSWTNKSG